MQNIARTDDERRLLDRLNEKISAKELEYRIFQFVRKHGRFFSSAPVPESVRLGPLQECFANARDLSEKNPDLTYCEGYVLIMKSDGQGGAPVHRDRGRALLRDPHVSKIHRPYCPPVAKRA
jgi:hypothetical protein